MVECEKIPPIKASIKIDADVHKVWNALFNEHGWDPWMTDGMKVDMREGGEIRFRWVIEGEEVTDRGVNLIVFPPRLWEFQWYEYEDGFRSKVAISLHESSNGGTWVEVEDRVLVIEEGDLEIAFGCAVGWGEFLARLKLFVERGIVL